MVSNGRARGGTKEFKCRSCKVWRTVPATDENTKQADGCDWVAGKGVLPDGEGRGVSWEAASGTLKVGNVAEILTVEDAMKRVGLVADDWHIDEISLKPYTQGQKGPDGNPRIVQLMSAHWKLTPKIMEGVGLRPVLIDATSIYNPAPIGGATDGRDLGAGEPKTTLVFGDMHFGFSKSGSGGSGGSGGASSDGSARVGGSGDMMPFHDKKAINCMMKIAKAANITEAVCLGDALDFTEFTTRWLLRPEHDGTTQKALEECAQFFYGVRALVDKNTIGLDVVSGAGGVARGEVVYIEGNHEKRLWDNLIASSARSMFVLEPVGGSGEPLVTVSGLLGLKKMGVRYEGTYPEGYPKGRVWINPGLLAIHGSNAAGAGGASAWKTLGDIEKSVLFGHIHRIEHVSKTYHGLDKIRVRGAWGIGCLCHVDGGVPTAKAEERWQQGFAVVSSVGDKFHVEQVHIVDGVAMWRGNIYVG